MEDVNESLSKNNIIVDGIMDFPGSPHDVNKKAYSFRMGKGAQNWYSSRLVLIFLCFQMVSTLKWLNSSHQLWTK